MSNLTEAISANTESIKNLAAVIAVLDSRIKTAEDEIVKLKKQLQQKALQELTRLAEESPGGYR